MTDLSDVFGDVIHTYTREQAIADGALVEVPADLAGEAGFRWPVALTQAAWADLVAWDKGGAQSETGRLWDVLWMASVTIRTSDMASQAGGQRLNFVLHRVKNAPHHSRAARTVASIRVGPGDAGEPVLTIMLPHED